jgi:hypothetical protein
MFVDMKEAMERAKQFIFLEYLKPGKRLRPDLVFYGVEVRENQGRLFVCILLYK